MGQIVEKPRGDLEKVLPREDLKPRDVPKANPRAQIVEKPREDLEKVLPREDLKPRDVLKANPRVQPEGLPSEYPKPFRFSHGGTFFR